MSLLTLRKTIKAKKPIYKRQDEHKKARLRTSWRKPKGRDSKMRLGHKGHKKRVGIGYGSPRQVKHLQHLHGAGLRPVVVHNLQEMLSINNEKEIAVIAHSVGLRKALAIAKKAKERMVKFLNLDVDGFVKYADELMKKKREERPSKETKKKKTAEETAGGKEELAEKVAKEEKKQEKEEKDKLLIRREL